MLTTVEKVLYLQEADLLDGVPAELLAEVAELTDEVTMTAGEAIYTEGDPADSLYVVLSGRVTVTRERNSVDTLGAGTVFGAWAVFEDGPRMFTATAADGVQLLALHRLDLEEFMDDHTRVKSAVLKSLARRLRLVALGA